MPSRLFVLLMLCLAACKETPPAGFIPVQDSAMGTPRVSVALNRITNGLYRSIAPFCIGQRYVESGPSPYATTGLALNPGQIVEFRNYQPDVPSNVTSLSAPAPLFSPNLVKPYNIVVEGTETYSYWRHAFPTVGTYEYYDTNMGTPGRQVVDTYYGTVTYVGESSAPKGTVCVDPPSCVASAECLAGSAPAGTTCCTCLSVCCDSDDNCVADPTKKMCLRGRCVDPAQLDAGTP